MLKVSRLSAKFDILPLFKGKVSISNVQLFGFNINLEKKTPEDIPNFQFVLDAFASKDTIKKESNLDIRINSLLIRRGKMSYNVLSAEETPGKFNAQHIQLRNIIANISLKALQNDSVNAAVKRLSIEEENSGFELKKLSLKIVANNQKMSIENFAIDLPNTSLAMDTIRMEYDSLGAFRNFTNDVRFSLRIFPFITDYTHDPTSSLYRIDGDNYSGMGMYIPNSFTTPKYLLWNNYFKSSIAWYHASGWAETESIWGN